MAAEKKVALVTGSSSGLGAVTAVEFARQGIRVTKAGQNQEILEEVSKTCQAAELVADDVLVMPGDITDDATVKSMVQASVDKFGRLDIVVNSAEMDPPLHGVMDGSMELYEQVMKTNLRATIMLTKEVVPHLEKTKVQRKSVLCDQQGSIRSANKVLFYSPGHYDSADNEQSCVDPENFEKFMESCLKIQPLQYVGKSEDIAKAIGFLASEDACFITGTCLVLDGGYGNVVPFPSPIKI